MDNLEIAKIFSHIADILEIKNENPFKVRAYRKAAESLENLTQNINQLYKENKVETIPGVGKGIAEKIGELIETGKLKYYEDLKKKIPESLVEIMNVPEMGPKTTALLYEKLKIDSIEKLKDAALKHKISKLPGMGEKTEENILKGIELLKRAAERMPLNEAMDLSDKIIAQLERMKEVKKISIAGSLRRMRETIGDIDILVVSDNPRKVMDKFASLGFVKEILSKGDTKSSILTSDSRQVDLRIVAEESFGAALHYFTGSKQHNIKIRELGIKKGLKINEYGIFKKGKGQERRIGGKQEKDVFDAVGLPFIPIELREDRGEIEAGLNNQLPELIEEKDIKGDLHVHSDWSDGHNTIEEMAQAAKSRGYKYVCICDHSKSLAVAHGVKEENFLKRLDEIREADRKIKNIKVLAGSEVDIGSDGNLDYPKKLLKELDIVIASVHSGFHQPRGKITKRIVKAMESGLVDIIAHPTGRLLGEREPYEVDLEEVFKIAKKTNTMLEINAYPRRMDLNDINAKIAKETGVKLIMNTDSHNVTHFDWLKFGIAVARRAWLEAEDVANTYPLEKFLKNLKRRK